MCWHGERETGINIPTHLGCWSKAHCCVSSVRAWCLHHFACNGGRGAVWIHCVHMLVTESVLRSCVRRIGVVGPPQWFLFRLMRHRGTHTQVAQQQAARQKQAVGKNTHTEMRDEKKGVTHHPSLPLSLSRTLLCAAAAAGASASWQRAGT